jgi:hypothetical protein
MTEAANMPPDFQAMAEPQAAMAAAVVTVKRARSWVQGLPI